MRCKTGELEKIGKETYGISGIYNRGQKCRDRGLSGRKAYRTSFILDGCQDGPMMTIKREAKKHDTMVKYVDQGAP